MFSSETATSLNAYQVKAIDTTAAGDVFNGALAAGLAENQSIAQAAGFASAAAALSVTRPGAQTSIPEREELDEFLHTRGAPHVRNIPVPER